jgi:hypothetical protein
VGAPFGCFLVVLNEYRNSRLCQIVKHSSCRQTSTSSRQPNDLPDGYVSRAFCGSDRREYDGGTLDVVLTTPRNLGSDARGPSPTDPYLTRIALVSEDFERVSSELTTEERGQAWCAARVARFVASISCTRASKRARRTTATSCCTRPGCPPHPPHESRAEAMRNQSRERARGRRAGGMFMLTHPSPMFQGGKSKRRR